MAVPTYLISVAMRSITIFIAAVLMFSSTSACAEAPITSTLPKTESGLRKLIGAEDFQEECIVRNQVQSCWRNLNTSFIYEEETSFSKWHVRCFFAVRTNWSGRRCTIGSHKLSVVLSWEENDLSYEAGVSSGTTANLNSYAPVYVTIDAVTLVSPEDSEYGKLALETESGEKVSASDFAKILETANSITTVTWDENDKEGSVTRKGVGFAAAHKFAADFLNRTL